jgi:oligopeptidase A
MAPDVRFFRIERDGKLIGQFYLDLYARAGKSGGAWMDDARPPRRRHQRANAGRLPDLQLHRAAVDGVTKPALFTHDEVITLFHEFGHGLHHMLTQVDELGVSGISGVEWDAVELPSQFMENFCWEWEVLEHMTAHAVTGEPLRAVRQDAGRQELPVRPADPAPGRVLAARHAPALRLRRQWRQERAAADRRSARQVRAGDSAAFNRFQNSFGHIFAGGYAAGYYSYKWAEVLSADAYAAFEEAQKLGPAAVSETGKRYLAEILSVGGSRPALESFTAFRGREPSIDALLRPQRHGRVTISLPPRPHGSKLGASGLRRFRIHWIHHDTHRLPHQCTG